MTNKELEARIKELERLAKKHDDDILQLTENVDGLIEEKHKEKPNHEFKVGDRVQFKSWEEMEKEFGHDEYGCIRLPNGWAFNRGMKHFCGTYATIEFINENDIVGLKDMTDDRNADHWSYTLGMFKPAADEPKCKFKVGDKVKNVGNKDNHYNKVGIVEKCMGFAKEVATNIYIIKFDDLDPIEHSLQYECDLESYTEPRWAFTDDEKVILRNLPEEYKWIARDENYKLYVYSNKPYKISGEWRIDKNNYDTCKIMLYFDLFQSIKWQDDKPCEFRKYL